MSVSHNVAGRGNEWSLGRPRTTGIGLASMLRGADRQPRNAGCSRLVPLIDTEPMAWKS